jgi:hypothetical protein
MDPDYFDEFIFGRISAHAGLPNVRFHDLRHRADSPIMPNVSKGDSPACRLARSSVPG